MLLPPTDEAERLNALIRYQIHTLEADGFLNDFTQLAAEVCGAPTAVLSITKPDRIEHVSRAGTGIADFASEDSFISRAMLDRGRLVIQDALTESGFKTAASTSAGNGIRFYAGAPLSTPDGFLIGVLSVMDDKPRQLSDAQARSLSSLAQAIMSRLELRRKSLELDQAMSEREKAFESLNASEERCAMLLRGASDG